MNTTVPENAGVIGITDPTVLPNAVCLSLGGPEAVYLTQLLLFSEVCICSVSCLTIQLLLAE